MRRFLLLFVTLLFSSLSFEVPPAYTQPDPYIRSDRLGIAHISSASPQTVDERYQRALDLGAGWNRWPLYWNWVESAPGEWDWNDYDQQVMGDLAYGLNINAILMGRPEFYADGQRIQGIHQPIFADGSDFPAAGKALNPENPWVTFVYEAVNRYKPGGVLAQQVNFPAGAGIRVWEIWNEPDYAPFWQASVRDYARLLKISYIVAKLADPGAQIMFGGLLYPTQNNWLAQVLNIYINDPMHEQYNWFMDIVGIHSYVDPWRSGWLTLVARQTLVAYEIDRPIWLNETGVSVWDDYPGPLWEATSPRRATSEQQAWYFVQSAVYAWSEGADKVFFHQLYDDCGDQPAGTDFPLHTGELCLAGAICAGDAHGIYRNTDSSLCFSQHPLAGTPRPSAQAFRLLAEVFGAEAFDKGRRQYLNERVVSIMFGRPRTGERITVLWNRTLTEARFELEAVGSNAQLISLGGSVMLLPNGTGNYTINLPPAKPDNHPDPPPGAEAAIGGPPFILIEQPGTEVIPARINLDIFHSERMQISAVPTMPPPRATIDPAVDTRPPVAHVQELPPTSAPTFTVTWHGEDDSGIESFLIWVRVDGGNWQPWLETAQTSAQYTGTSGSTYEFAAWAVDLAGNWSANVDLQPQAVTQVE